MDIIQEIDFTGDIVVNGVTQNYYLDLYFPTESSYTNKSQNGRDIRQEENNNYQRIKDNVPDTGEEDISYAEVQPCLSDNLDYGGDISSRFSRELRHNPFVIFIHGGGWRRGDRDAWKHYLYYDVNFLVSTLTWLFGTYSNVGEAFARNGISCAVISYPLTELGMPWIFIEMLASYLQSCFFVFATLFVPGAIISLFRMTGDIHNFSHWTYMHHGLKTPQWKEKVLLTLLLTNLLTAFLFTLRRHKFNMKKSYISLMWSFITVLNFPLKFNFTIWLIQAVFVTFIIVQYTILRLRLNRSGRSVRDQVKVVAKAIKWVQNSSRPKNMFVMGHSAGGHLATLTVTDKRILQEEGCSAKSLRGVISVSGIYDVRCLNTPIINRFYLYPTFGENENQWLKASPEHIIKSTKQNSIDLPPFLLISAEKDLFLKPQSWQFYRTLKEAEVDCRHIEIKNTNHFSVIINFKKSFYEKDSSPIADVLQFVRRYGSE